MALAMSALRRKAALRNLVETVPTTRAGAEAAVAYFTELDRPHGNYDLALALSRSLARAIPA